MMAELGSAKNDKTHAEQTDRVHADKQPERHSMKSLAQRLDTRGSYAKDRDRKRDGQAEAGRAKSVFA